MNTTYKQQIEAIREAKKYCLEMGLSTIRDEMDSALNDSASTIAALHLSDPYKEIERLQAELKEANDIISHYADVNQNQ